MHPMIRPLTVSPLEAIEINMSAAIPNTKYSGGPIISANAVMGPANNTKDNQPIRPPTSEAPAAIPSAVPARPCRVIGYPSHMLATVPGPPGTLRRMEPMESPKVHDDCMDVSRMREAAESMPMVNGRARVTAKLGPTTGKTPTTSPMQVPSNKKKILAPENAC